MNVNFTYSQHKRVRRDSSEGNSSEEELSNFVNNVPRPGKKTRGRVKVKMELIKSKLRRYTTFSKRKTGLMKKAYELATLTGTQVMILVASETGHVYTFATQKLQPMITSDAGKVLIQTCLNSPDQQPPGKDSRMTETGYEEVDLNYNVHEETDTNHSGSNPDDPQDSIAASYSQASSPEPSPESVTHTEPPLMTIPPHVMAELLKTAQHNDKHSIKKVDQANDQATQNKDQDRHQISVQHNKQAHQILATPGSQSARTQFTLQTAANNTINETTFGQLNFQGHFSKTEDKKQSDRQPPVTVFRPIVPKNNMESAGTLSKTGKPPGGMYKSIAPASIIKSESQPIILTYQHQNLPVHLLDPLPQNTSHSTPLQDTAPQNLSLNKRK